QNIDDRSLVRRLGRFYNLLTFNFCLNHRQQVIAIVVFILVRLERRFQGLDQRLGQLQFFGLHGAGIGTEFFHLTNLIGIVHGVKENPLTARPQNHDVFAVVHGDVGHTHITALAQSFEQQSIGLFAALIGRQVIGALEINGIDLGGLHELEHFHSLGRLGGDLLDLFVFDDHVLVFFVLVAFDDVAALDRLVLRLAVKNLLHARVIGFVQLIEAYGLTAGSAVQSDG